MPKPLAQSEQDTQAELRKRIERPRTKPFPSADDLKDAHKLEDLLTRLQNLDRQMDALIEPPPDLRKWK